MQMAEDLRHPGHLLMAENHCLKTLNLANQQTSLVVGNSYIAGHRECSGGSARFNILSGFEQINSSHVLITDVYNHCIRLLDRSTNTTTMIAGVCGWSGHRDSPLTSARFNTPFKIIRLPNTDRYLISDYGNLLIRELSLATRQVYFCQHNWETERSAAQSRRLLCLLQLVQRYWWGKPADQTGNIPHLTCQEVLWIQRRSSQ